MGTKKNFVLDTNVILHDYNCLKNFQENDIYLPLVVLEELDKFKKGNEQINFNAREFVRELDVLTSDEQRLLEKLMQPSIVIRLLIMILHTCGSMIILLKSFGK